jgi:hypothetical protein
LLPERPAGTDGWTEEQLATLVTRDAMIGTGLPKPRLAAMNSIHDMGGAGLRPCLPVDEPKFHIRGSGVHSLVLAMGGTVRGTSTTRAARKPAAGAVSRDAITGSG